jgi:hypothetical protein
MFGRRRRREQRLYWEGFWDAIVDGGMATDDRPRYPQGFEDGKRAAKRIHRDALVTEVSRLSLKPGDKLVVKAPKLTTDAVEMIKAQLEPRFPDNEILVCDGDVDISVVRPETIVIQSILDGKVVAQATAEIGNDGAAPA